MEDTKHIWLSTQLHWDDKEAIQRRKVSRSIAFNWRKITRLLQSLCREKSRMLGSGLVMVDLGCGAGKFYDGLESVVDLYIGIDPSDRMLSYALRNQRQFFIRGNGEHIPLQDGIADVVLLKSVLDVCFSPQQVIAEANRLLKDGGWLLISLSNRSAYFSFLRKLYRYLLRRRGEHFFDENIQLYFNMTDVADMLERGQFEIIRRISAGYFVLPRCFDWMVSPTLLLKLIDIADRIGSAILPQRGGGFIIAGQKPVAKNRS